MKINLDNIDNFNFDKKKEPIKQCNVKVCDNIYEKKIKNLELLVENLINEVNNIKKL